MEDKDYPYCPGRCKRTLKCYGETWFLAKPGKQRECKGDCKYRREWESMQYKNFKITVEEVKYEH